MEVLESMESMLVYNSITSFLSSAFSIACYVLMSLGMYTIAKRRGISKPWLAWLPFGSSWIMGSISDQYRYVTTGETKSKRKILLGLDIASSVCAVIILVMAFSMLFKVIGMAMADYYVDEEIVIMEMLGSLGGMLLMLLPLMGVAIAYAIINYMAMYDLYKSTNPEHSVLFLVLSIIFGIQAFFIFFNRNKDLGMPPRKDAPAGYIPAQPQQTYQQPQQTWQQPQQNWQQPQQNWQQPQQNWQQPEGQG